MVNLKYAHCGSAEDRLIEEMGELIQAICKARRFGYWNHHPDRPRSSNMDEIRSEMDDVREKLEGYTLELDQISRTRASLEVEEDRDPINVTINIAKILGVQHMVTTPPKPDEV